MKEKPYTKFFKEDRRNSIPESFDEWVAKTFGDVSHFLFQYSVQDDDIHYGDIDREDYETDEEYDEATDQLRDEELNNFISDQEGRFQDWLIKYKHIAFPKTLYRVLQLKSETIEDIAKLRVTKVFKDGIGIYWTDGEAEMEAYSGKGGNKYTVRADVNEDSINWENTLFNNMNPNLGEDESEIQLNKGAKIHLTGIAKGATSHEESFEPLNVMVRA